MNDKWELYIWFVTVLLALTLIVLLNEVQPRDNDEVLCTPETIMNYDTKE